MSRALSRNMVVTVHGTCGSLGYLAIFFINILIILGVVFSSYELLWRSTNEVNTLCPTRFVVDATENSKEGSVIKRKDNQTSEARLYLVDEAKR